MSPFLISYSVQCNRAIGHIQLSYKNIIIGSNTDISKRGGFNNSECGSYFPIFR